MSKTDMVRCKSLVENTRVEIVEVMNQETEVENEKDSENESMTDASVAEDGNGEHHMDVARVYENTIVLLGELLADSSSPRAAPAGD